MTADAGGARHSDPDSTPIDAEDYPATTLGTTHGAGDAETELVPPRHRGSARACLVGRGVRR